MERSTVQSCLAAPVFLSKKPYKISVNPRFRLTAGFSHFSYFGRNRPGKRVSTDTKLAQRFAFCPLIQTMQPAAFSLRTKRAAANLAGGFWEVHPPSSLPASNRTRPRGSLGARDSHLRDHRCAPPNSPPRPMTRALSRSRATYGSALSGTLQASMRCFSHVAHERPLRARSGQSGIHWVRSWRIFSSLPLSPQPVREEDLEGHVARSAMTRHTPRPPLDCRWRQLRVHRIVDVTSPIAAIERRTIVAGQRQVASQPLGQIRIGDEVAAEGDEVGVARRYDGRGTLTGETARRRTTRSP
jgi:hypothetical protein